MKKATIIFVFAALRCLARLLKLCLTKHPCVKKDMKQAYLDYHC